MEQTNRHLGMLESAVTVSAFLKALNNNDFEEAGELMDENVKFEGVLGSVEGRDEYVRQMAKMKLRYDVKNLLYDEHSVSVLYEIDMSGKKVLTSGWYEVHDGKITHIRVIFDPRPVLGA
ncbi:nuclear transport factor 2 family protein [Dyadobacter fermentans]|uniref:nuclear transport factor 2 family protein n=1 Tax=Dyadobacter fermentans TaxID=94254 RepID=UPI001CBDB351|nr:nuclear transport factor 2 family protein [Dyadobacter fermentans]MBZ1359773.1 nuclear transport factor 2 family protein [Dyadobacter fermentans]